MSEFLKILLNIRSLRAVLRELSFEQLQEAHEKFSLIYQERAADVEKSRAAEAERLDKLATFQAMLADAGIDPSELVQSTSAGKSPHEGRKRAQRPPKYRYMENGVEKTWTGQGRTPKALAVLQEQGRQLDEFLI